MTQGRRADHAENVKKLNKRSKILNETILIAIPANDTYLWF